MADQAAASQCISPLQQRLDRRVKRAFLALIGSVIVAVVLTWYIGYLWSRGLTTDWRDVRLVLIAGATPFFIVMTIRSGLVARHLLDMLPRHAGRLCHKCRWPLREEGDEQLQCPRCGRRLTLQQAHRYWHVFVHSERLAEQIADKLDEPVEDRQPPHRLSMLGVALISALVGLGAAGVKYATTSAVAASLLMAMFIAIIAAGFIVASAAMRQPMEGRPKCARCGYERGEDSMAIEKCPECAAPWNEFGWLNPVYTQGQPRLAMIGLPVIVLGFMLLIISETFQWSLALEGDGALVRSATRTESYNAQPWEELIRRPLNEADRRATAAGLMKWRTRGVQTYAYDAWLLQRVIADELDEGVAHQLLFGEMHIMLEPVEGRDATFRLTAVPAQRPGGFLAPMPIAWRHRVAATAYRRDGGEWIVLDDRYLDVTALGADGDLPAIGEQRDPRPDVTLDWGGDIGSKVEVRIHHVIQDISESAGEDPVREYEEVIVASSLTQRR